MEGKLSGLVGLVLLTGFLLLILWKIPSTPLIVIVGIVLLMALWHWIEEEWLSGS